MFDEYIFKIIGIFLENKKGIILFYLLVTILSFPLESIVIPQIYGEFFKECKDTISIDIFKYYISLIAIVLVIVNSANFLSIYIESYLIPELSAFTINWIFKNILELYENNITDIELGKLIGRISLMPNTIHNIADIFCNWILPRLLAIIIINIYFFYINWKLGTLSVGLLAIFLSINIGFFESCSQLSKERHELFEKKNQETQDKLSNSFSIYSMGNIKTEIELYEKETAKYKQKAQENYFCTNKSTFLSSIMIVILMVALNSMTVWLLLKKKINHSQLMAIFMVIIYYIPSINTINNIFPNIVHLYGSISVMNPFLKDLWENHLKKTANNGKKKEKGVESNKKLESGSIIIRHLNFGYTEDNLIFNNFNLSVLDKEKIAIMGSSGSGKSTLIKLIMGYYPVPENTIYIDETDINEYDLNELRKQISYVNQNTRLFNKTILENIQYGNSVSEKTIKNFIEENKLNEIFVHLKDGLETKCGVDGEHLSGGQKQMVHILRCIFKKNHIVILDEPTTALDTETKHNILSAIKILSEQSTLIIITHDEMLLNIVDRVIKL
jgi:ABC-type multidrug transport system fused ATPase/permease subunit